MPLSCAVSWAACCAPDQPVCWATLRFASGGRGGGGLLARAWPRCGTSGPRWRTCCMPRCCSSSWRCPGRGPAGGGGGCGPVSSPPGTTGLKGYAGVGGGGCLGRNSKLPRSDRPLGEGGHIGKMCHVPHSTWEISGPLTPSMHTFYILKVEMQFSE